MRLKKWEVRDSVRDHLNLLRCHIMHGPEKPATFFCHDNTLRRPGNNLPHDVALCRRRCWEHRMKRRDYRHGEAFQKLDDVFTGVAAKNPILMLKANNVQPR